MQSFSLPSNHKDVSELLKKYKNNTEKDWTDQGKTIATSLYHNMLASVPAYKKHIAQYPEAVLEDGLYLAQPIDKENYLKTYERSELCWDGQFKGQAWSVSATSGSSGVPYYFPRQALQDEQYAVTAEAYLLENFSIDTKTTLYINAFPMGVWIGGVFTYEAVKRVANKGYALSIITPGINKLEVIKAVQNLAADFDQIIIGSYAPFLKDILDDGEKMGVDWKSLDLKFVFSAEAFSEEFRDFLKNKTGMKSIYKDSLNHYGTVDLGTMAHETPLCILLRRIALQHPEFYTDLFGGANKLPTLAQFDPTLFYFESDNGNLYCSAYSGLPLYRYDLKDRGGVLTRSHINELCEKHGILLDQYIVEAGIADTLWNLPFVYVFERSDFSVSFFAFQVYPETVRKALLHTELQEKVTGKCTMSVTYDETGVQYLDIHVELMSGIDPSEDLQVNVQDKITQLLLQENSEYRKTSEEVGVERVRPRITFWPYESETYFKAGGKQKWVIK